MTDEKKPPFHTGGTVTGRWKEPLTFAEMMKPMPYQEEAIRYLFAPPVDGEEVPLMRRRYPTYIHDFILKGDPTDRLSRPTLDPIVTTYPLFPPSNPPYQMKLADYAKSDVEVALRLTAFTSDFEKQMAKVGQLLAEKTDRILLSHICHFLPGSFKREHRIVNLLMSPNKRKRKRGDRLFVAWRKNRPGYNLQGKSK